MDFMNLLKARDEDSITLGKNAIINPVIGTIRYDRPGNYFQEWNGTAWIPLVIAMTSGGLGANTPAGGRAALGIGTMGTQNANNVTITGGTIQGLGSLGVNGAASLGSLGVSGDAYLGSNLGVVGNATINGNTTIAGNTRTNSLEVVADAGIYGTVYGQSAVFAGKLHLGNVPTLVSNTEGKIDATKFFNIVPPVNLGTGTPTIQTFLRGDGAWAELNMGAYRNNQSIHTIITLTGPGIGTHYDIPLTGFTNVSKMMWVGAGPYAGANFLDTEVYIGHYWFPDVNTLRYQVTEFNGGDKPHTVAGMVLEVL